VKDDLQAGKTPDDPTDEMKVKDLCNRFLTAKLRKVVVPYLRCTTG
jgi:hypothetical protein